MRRAIYIFLIVLMLSVFLLHPVFAGGDKVRGEKGQGCVNQVQVEDPDPAP